LTGPRFFIRQFPIADLAVLDDNGDLCKQDFKDPQQEHTQKGAIGGQGGHSAKRPDWACKPNHFPVSVSQKENLPFLPSIFHSRKRNYGN
jgi:hypothetical protein